MSAPHIKFDWTINLGHITSAIVFVLAGFFAYTDIKSELRNQQTVSENKFREYDRLWSLQQKIDDDQNARMLRIFDALTKQIAEVKNDIRGDIRDLRIGRK